MEYPQSDIIALKGGTVTDLDNFGQSTNDLKNSIVLIEGKKIKLVGSPDKVKIPKGAKVIDVKGKYIVPGLIDAFATLNNQAYANAFLYMGVTTIVGIEGKRRGAIFQDANPKPKVLKFDAFNGWEWSKEKKSFTRKLTQEEIIGGLDSLAATGVKVLLLHYGTEPEILKLVVNRCKMLDIALIGELGSSTYKDALEAGVSSFVHTSRYSVDIIPTDIREAYKEAPFGPPRIKMYQYFKSFDPEKDAPFQTHAKTMGKANVALIPTLSLIYPAYPFAKNYWEEPIAKILNPKDIHLPVEKSTGRWIRNENTAAWDTLLWSEKLVMNMLKMEQIYHKNGAKYIAGSGVDAFGTMPGISLHIELEMFSRIGLTNREAIAAATTNYGELFGWNHIGKIEAEREADILVLEENPLDNLAHLKKIEWLILDGEIID